MPPTCHRCHAELPVKADDRRDDEDAGLFCPHCAAPQLLLPEHLRAESGEVPAANPQGASTGTLPPPRVHGARGIDWRAALTVSATVGVTAAVLTIVGLRLSGVALLGVLWVLSGGLIAVRLYQRRAALRSVDTRVGLRVGTAAGLLMAATIAIAGAATGVVLRFGTHSLQRFDQQSAEQARQVQAWMIGIMARQGEDKAALDQYVALMNSPRMTAPEMKAGGALAQLGFQGLIIVLVSAAGGAFAGMLQGRRQPIDTQGNKV